LLQQQNKQNRKMLKATQQIGKQQTSYIQMPQNNFNSTQKIRFSQSNQKQSMERASLQQSGKLNILPNATLGYNTNQLST